VTLQLLPQGASGDWLLGARGAHCAPRPVTAPASVCVAAVTAAVQSSPVLVRGRLHRGRQRLAGRRARTHPDRAPEVGECKGCAALTRGPPAAADAAIDSALRQRTAPAALRGAPAIEALAGVHARAGAAAAAAQAPGHAPVAAALGRVRARAAARAVEALVSGAGDEDDLFYEAGGQAVQQLLAALVRGPPRRPLPPRRLLAPPAPRLWGPVRGERARAGAAGRRSGGLHAWCVRACAR